MNWRHDRFVGCSRLLKPMAGPKLSSYHLWRRRDGCNQGTIRCRQEHSVNVRMRIEGRVKPLLGCECGIRRAQDSGDFGKRLVIIDNGTTAAEVVTNYMAKQLDQSLSVAQDSRFQRVTQDCVGNNERQDRRDPTGQKNRKNDLETIETVVPSFRSCISQLHACLYEKTEVSRLTC